MIKFKPVSEQVLLLISMLLFITSCSERPWLESLPVLESDITVEMSRLDIPHDSLGTPRFLLALDDALVWSEDSPLCIKSYDFLSGEIRIAGVTAGRAGSELMCVHQLLEAPESGSFAVYDNLQQKMLVLKRNEDRSWVTDSVLTLSGMSSVALAEDGTMVGPRMDGARYGVITPDGNREFGDYHEWGMETVAAWNPLQGMVQCVSGRMVWFAYYQPACQIVDYRSSDVVSSHILYDGDRAPADLTQGLTPDSEVGFISISATSEAVYALYDGKPLSTYMNSSSKPYGNNIICMDWDGKMTGRFCSSLPVVSISVRDGYMYVLTINGDGYYEIGKVCL